MDTLRTVGQHEFAFGFCGGRDQQGEKKSGLRRRTEHFCLGTQRCTLPSGAPPLNLGVWAGLLAIVVKSIAIKIAIVGEKSISILIAILFAKKYCNSYCNTFCNTGSRPYACKTTQH